ncbi:MAG: ABC transporter ATP-binding protein, partial [Rhodospirillales bacterium]
MSLPVADAPAIEVRGVNKWFGTNHANRDIDLAIARGTIHGIVGENGAGKSTTMNIVYGYLQPDTGEIRVGGRPLAVRSPRDAIAAGIGMVHQHFMLVDPFTVLENVLLGAEGGMTLAAGARRARDELARLEKDYALEVDLDAVVGDLPVGVQQRLEILKALFRGAEILILDEPTGVLTPQEVDHLFRILRALKAQGKTIVIITHKLREVMELTDTVTVMRRGEVVATKPTAETSREELASLMVGRSVVLRVEKPPAAAGRKVLEVEGLTVVDGQGVRRVKDATFDVRAGEIVGVAGVSGNGQTELMEALAGMRPIASGRVRV